MGWRLHRSEYLGGTAWAMPAWVPQHAATIPTCAAPPYPGA